MDALADLGITEPADAADAGEGLEGDQGRESGGLGRNRAKAAFGPSARITSDFLSDFRGAAGNLRAGEPFCYAASEPTGRLRCEEF